MAEEKQTAAVNAQPEAETAAPAQEAAESKKEKPAKADKKDKQIEKELQKAQQELEKTQKDMAELKDTFLRTAAEYDNFRKRSAKEQEASFSNGLIHAVKQLLPVIDTLEMAANAATTDENYKKGVTMTLDKCTEVLNKMGITEIEALDKPFDPQLHAAVMQQADTGKESGTVTQVLQKGYSLRDKIIRHAAVAVAE